MIALWTMFGFLAWFIGIPLACDDDAPDERVECNRCGGWDLHGIGICDSCWSELGGQ